MSDPFLEFCPKCDAHHAAGDCLAWLRKQYHGLRARLQTAEQQLASFEVKALGKDAKAVLDEWIQKGGLRNDPALGILQATLQAFIEQQLETLQGSLNEAEFHTDNYRRSFEEMKAASIESANRANAAEQQLGQVREEVTRLQSDAERLASCAQQAYEDRERTRDVLSIIPVKLHHADDCTPSQCVCWIERYLKALSTPSDGCGKGRTDGDLITVCDKCLQASCWQGIFMCVDSQNAGITKKSRQELRVLNLENESYWKTDDQLAASSSGEE